MADIIKELFQYFYGIFILIIFGLFVLPALFLATGQSGILMLLSAILIVIGIIGMLIGLLEAIRKWV